MGRKYQVNDNFFNSIDNQDKAWLLGLLYADGCVYDDGVIKIDLTVSDRELLEKIKKLIDCEYEIKQYGEGKKKFTTNNKIYDCKDMCRLSWRSKQMKEDLEKLGCCHNKTYILKFPTEEIIPNEFIKDFIRGYMDGDGGISYWIPNKNTNWKKFELHFCGTTEMIYGIAEIFKSKFNCCPSISSRYEDRNNNNKQFNVCGNRVILKILNWLYSDANMYMQRKHEKYLELKEEIKRVDNDHNLYGSAIPRRQVIKLDTLEIYESCAECARQNHYKSTAPITIRCQKRNGYMYLDEYEKEKNNGFR